jgi:hypothetical protein
MVSSSRHSQCRYDNRSDSFRLIRAIRFDFLGYDNNFHLPLCRLTRINVSATNHQLPDHPAAEDRKVLLTTHFLTSTSQISRFQ